MKVFWLDGALNLQGENEAELEALAIVYHGLLVPCHENRSILSGAESSENNITSKFR